VGLRGERAGRFLIRREQIADIGCGFDAQLGVALAFRHIILPLAQQRPASIFGDEDAVTVLADYSAG